MSTPNLNLPEILQNQSAKEITHNQALRIIDVLVPVALVKTRVLHSPPGRVAGDMYIVGTPATKAWANQENNLAYTDGASWYFITPKNKWPAYVADENLQYRFSGEIWEPDLPVAYNLGDLKGDVKIDYKNGKFQYGVLVGDVSLEVIGVPPEGYVSEVILEFSQDEVGKHEVKFGKSFNFYDEQPLKLNLEPNAKNVVMTYIRSLKNR